MGVQSQVVTGRQTRREGVLKGGWRGRGAVTGRGGRLIEVTHRGLESGRRVRSRSDLFICKTNTNFKILIQNTEKKGRE